MMAMKLKRLPVLPAILRFAQRITYRLAFFPVKKIKPLVKDQTAEQLSEL